MYEPLVSKARTSLRGSHDKAHDINHAKRVVENARLLSIKLKYADLDLIKLCAWWHDIGRLSKDDGHELISANLLKNELINNKYSSTITNNAFVAIRYHKWTMTPVTFEGNILRDADKLDFISPERWKSCLQSNQLKHLIAIKELLHQLRNALFL
jgi:HD superfamily phosphodiesterase